MLVVLLIGTIYTYRLPLSSLHMYNTSSTYMYIDSMIALNNDYD